MKTLFDETILKNLKLKNRFFKAAVWENMATIDGHLTDKLYAVYDKAANVGVWLILKR